MKFNYRGSLGRIKTTLQKPETQKTIDRAVTFAAVSLLGSAIGSFADNIYRSVAGRIGEVQKPIYFKRMVEAHPELSKENPESVGKLWRTLYHHAPDMAKDPVAAGAFIRQSIGRGYIEEWGGPSPDTYKTLTDVQKGLADRRPDASDIGAAAKKGFSATMTAGLLGESGEEWAKSEDFKKKVLFPIQANI